MMRLLFALLLWPVGLWAGEIQVTGREQLLSALTAAKGGEVISLSPGSYGELDLFTGGPVPPSFAQTVTLKSADPSKPAVITGLKLTGAQNLTFQGLIFDYTYRPKDDPGQIRPFQVNDSKDVRFNQVVFDGDTARGFSPEDNGFPAGLGLSLRNVTRLTLENSEIRNFYRGLVVGEATDTVIRRNDLHDLRSDGMNFVKVTGLLVEANVIRDFHRSFASDDHADMIQFWSMNADYPSTDVTIRRNFLTVGRGDHTQGIFMRNEAVDAQHGGPSMFYRDVVIEENLIMNNHFHGITVGEVDGLTIRQNTLIRVPRRSDPDQRGEFAMMPGIQVAEASRNVAITDNIASRVPKSQRGWRQSGNALVQDLEPLAAGFYSRVFVNPFVTAPYEPENFRPLAGGGLDRDGLGAPMSAFHWGR
ncbi:right-handed parallel beta-helix repeat-containing protein [Donghicola mangrovi]|uniref:Right handed beta helix domain-containing protein n=1 Tax=Donghicola mangrovi TaxID=2729614 RepID=A0A850QE74_9RHOB|nr:right-handed parallel beta-helix repeat-containing protein [Donghicola mangrovi]NVO25220.1 hypothetical protein [Donghicola mangrovi]